MSRPTIPRPTVAPRMAAWASRPRVAANAADVRGDDAGPETEIPPEALACCGQCGANTGALSLSPDLQGILAGCVALGETVADDRAYQEGYIDGTKCEWRWGFICGVLCTSLLAVAVGLSGVLSQVLP